MKPEVSETIKAYKAAFFAANNCDVSVVYERGWFRIRCGGSSIGTRHRRTEMEKFTQALKHRVESRDA